MTERTQPAELGIQQSLGPRVPGRGVAALQLFAFACAIALGVLKFDPHSWTAPELWTLAILTGLAVTSELTNTLLPSGEHRISGSFLGIMLAAVLLGGPAASIVAILTISIGWLKSRESAHALRHNLVTFSWFPLLSGLWFNMVSNHQGPRLAALHQTPKATYFLLIFAAFMIGLILNFAMTAAYTCWIQRVPVVDKFTALKPIISAELGSAVLTLLAADLYIKLGPWGLILFALVLVIFQYLVGELLLSQSRAEDLRVRATTDDLTALANRKHFNDHVDAVIAESDTTPVAFGVLLLDLNHFKDINDALGHQYGDDLLADLGPRLAKLIGEGGLVARFGGDEFAIMPAVRTENMAALTAIAEDVQACIREPVAFDDITLQVDASIGVARFPHDGEDAQTLLRRADIAMYSAKAERESHRFYTHGQDHHSASRLSMVGDFRRALEKDNEIIVHFHPIVDLGSSQVHGAEALVRWQHPDLGLLQPAAFLEIVEQTGLIGAMTTRVLEKAIAECAAWHSAGRDLTISVNLSVRNLHDDMLSSQVAQMLDRHALPPAALKLEITESMILSDPQRALATVESLSDIGVRFAVDDFGTGHSSLANLRRLPVHELKIDRSVVTPMLNEESDGVIVRSTIELGHALGLKVVAEGVEDEVTLARLEEIGCDRAQGHFFSKPVPPIEFMRWVSRYEARFSAAA